MHRWASIVMALGLGACTTLDPEGQRADVAALVQGRTAGVNPVLLPAPDAALRPAPTPADAAATGTDGTAPALLASPALPTHWQHTLAAAPLSADDAVRLAVQNNPGLWASLAALGVSDAERVAAGTVPNPHLSLGRLREGQVLEIERSISFNVLGLLTLPWRARFANQQAELAKLQAAQDVIRLAADTRKAWIEAVAARQSVAYRRDALDAAEAAAELGRRMAKVGNWNALNAAREQALAAQTRADLLRAQAQATSAQERLTRLLGLDGSQARFTLPDRLPDVPATLPTDWQNPTELQALALRQRLDVRSAQAEAQAVAQSLGLTRVTGVVNALELSYTHNTVFDNADGARSTISGWGLDVPLPLFDWGQARNARAQALYAQAAARVRDSAVLAGSEVREAWQGWHSAWQLARHTRDELVPLRRRIHEEMVLRYSGMLSSVWELLADARQNILAVNTAIETQRDYWLAEADLRTALTGTSPGRLRSLAGPTAANTTAAGHGGH